MNVGILSSVATALGGLAIAASAASAAVTPVTSDGGGATALAQSMIGDPGILTSASFDAVPPLGTPHGTADAPLSFLPSDGTSFGILTSGNVTLADDPNIAPNSGLNISGPNVRGDTDFDVSVLRLQLEAPAGTNCISFDFAFYSDEYPEYVGTPYNDAFIAELDGSTWSTSGTTISAPDNFAFDELGEVVSINSTGATSMTLANAAGTTYDGATVLLSASTLAGPGAHTLYLSIFDQGDHVLDSAAFIDNIRFRNVANPATECEEGATPVADPSTTAYTGATSVQYSDAATLSGQLTDENVTPAVGIAGKQLSFTLGTQSASAGPTDAGGNASTSLTVTQQPGSVSSVGVSFAGDLDYADSEDSAAFDILKEDCTLAYSGDVLVAPLANTNLAADLGEPDSSLGDLSGKLVTFTVTDSSSNVQTFTATTDANGHAATSQPLAADVYGVAVAFAGDDFYTACATASDTLVTVQAAGNKVTGGGWIAIGTGRTSFGFNVVPQAGGQYSGQLQIRSHSGKSRYHAKVVSSVTAGAGSATWSGTGAWNGTPGYAYTVAVVDGGSSGAKKGDTIAITITSPGGAVVYSHTAQTLKGGNITVH